MSCCENTCCGGAAYTNEVGKMRDAVALMRETNMFSIGEVLAIKEAVDFYEDKEFHQHQTSVEPDTFSADKMMSSLSASQKGWAKGYEQVK